MIFKNLRREENEEFVIMNDLVLLVDGPDGIGDDDSLDAQQLHHSHRECHLQAGAY